MMILSFIVASPTRSLNALNVDQPIIKDKKPEIPYGGALTWGTTNPPLHINPILSTQGSSIVIIKLVFNRLVRVNAKGIIEPDLSDHWEISNNGKIYTFHLREGIRFHDGVELTSEDVAYTIQETLDPKNASPYRINISCIENVQVQDRYTIKFELTEPMPFFINKLADTEIVPKHRYVNSGILHSDHGEHPIGSGPFKFSLWDKTTNEIILLANEDYFEGRPYLDKMVIKVYPNNSSIWSALLRQEIDMVKFISSDDSEVLSKDNMFKVYAVPMGVYYALSYNLRDPLMTLEIRKAITHAINVPELIHTAGGGIVAYGPLYQGDGTAGSDLSVMEYDPSESVRLLGSEGWVDVDKDGVLEKEGNPLVIKVLVNSRNKTDQEILKKIRQQLTEVGIKMEVVLFDPKDQINVNLMGQTKAQAWLTFFYGALNDAENYDAALQWVPGKGRLANDNGYKNEEYNHLLNSLELNSDEKSRRDLFIRLNRIIFEDQPVSFLFYPVSYFAVSSDFGNTDDYFSPSMPSYTMRNWYRKN